MTTPFRYPDYNAQLGTESPVANSEWSTMLDRRRQMITDIENRLQLANVIRQHDPSVALTPGRDIAEADHTAQQHEQYGQNADGSPTKFQDYQTPPHQEELNQLYGAADYWGIANAKSMAPLELKQLIERKRVANEGGLTPFMGMTAADEILAKSAAAAGLGATQDLIGMAQHIPFIGHAIAANETVQKSSQWLAKMNEGVQAGMTEDERKGYRIAHGLGGMLGFIVPGEAAWAIAGAAGSVGALGTAGSIGRLVTSPIARGAIQGAAATWLLEGGGDQSNQEAAWKVGMGAAGGATFAALGEALPRIFEKVRASFKSRTDPLNNADLGPEFDWSKPKTEDADWYYEADHQLQNPNPPGPPALPPAGGSSAGPSDAAPFGTDPFRVDPQITHAPEAASMPGQPDQPSQRLLMSPERASLQDRINGLTEQRDMERRLQEVDGLTGLGNKTALERARGTVDADPDMGWAVFDGKQFKAVNDTHGHDVGDQVLKNFGRAIEQTAYEMQVPFRGFRHGGDEFAAIVPRDQMEAFANRVSELSYQKVGGVETRLDAYHAGEFGEADLSLMANKRASRAGGSLITPSNKGSYLAPDSEAAQSIIDTAFPPDMAARYKANLARLQDPATSPQMRNQIHTTLSFMEDQRPPEIQSKLAAIRGEAPAYQAPVDLSDNTVFEQGGSEAVLGYIQDRFNRGISADAAAESLQHPAIARGEAATLTKQATLMEGDTSKIADVGEFTEGDVATSAMAMHPGRVHIIQGVGDASKVVRQLTQGMTEGRIMPHQFRFVERGGQLDMLVSDGLPITNKRVDQYKRYGFFDQQQATVNGRTVQIMNVTGPNTEQGMSRVYDPYSEQTYLVPHDQILPGRRSAPAAGMVENGEKLYEDFKARVSDYMQSETVKLPPGTKTDPSWLSKETSSQLPRLMEQYLDAAVGNAPLTRAAVESYFNVRRVHDYQALAPEELSQLASTNKELAKIRSAMPVEHVGVEDLAVQKGFSYVPTPGELGGTLIDLNSDLRVPVGDEESADAFLRNFNRDLPDYTPLSEVPVEVAGSNPHAANPGNNLEPVLERGAEAEYSLTNRAGDALYDAFDRALAQPPASGGGGSTTPPPPPSRGSAIGGGGQNALPSGPQSLGQQFAEAARSRPQDLYRVQQKFDSAWLNYMMPFRSVALQVENDLKNIGISEGTLWKHYNDIVTNVTRAHNEALPWQMEWADIMSQFRRKHLRSGTVTKIQELVNYNDALSAMQKAGYNPQEIAAQKRISDFNDRFFQYLVDDPNYKLDASRYINGYMSHVRQRQGMPGISDPFADNKDILPTQLKFFAEMAREGNMQFRQMDARALGTKMIRAAMFKKHVGESYEAMARAWSDPRVPGDYSDMVRDWLNVVRTGHNPEYDVMIQGTRHFFNSMGLPVTNGEMATLSNIAFGNMYRAQLGGRPDAIFRDSIQPFFSGVRIGFQPVISAYNTLLTGGQATRDMIQRGLEGGWLEKGMAKVANADVFEHGVNTPEGVQLLPDNVQARRETLAKLGDLMWAATPKSLRNGLQGSRLDPLHYYTKLGEVNRLVSGEAGYQTAASALANYQYDMGRLMRGEVKAADGVMWIDTADNLMNQLLKDSKARVYPQPIQDEFKRLVAGGEMQQAAYLLANESANMQFRYGAKENPIGIRKMGNTGRAIMQFGTFTQQYIAQMNEMLRGPGVDPSEKVAMALRYATVSAALGTASALTGWNFGKWAWHQSLTFAGGPLFQSAQKAVQGATGAAAAAMGAPLTPNQKSAVDDYSRTTPGDVLSGIAASEFPYSSTARTVSHVFDMSTGMNPVEGTARTLITGENTLQPDINDWIKSMGERSQAPNAEWRSHVRGMPTTQQPGETEAQYRARMSASQRAIPGAGVM